MTGLLMQMMVVLVFRGKLVCYAIDRLCGCIARIRCDCASVSLSHNRSCVLQIGVQDLVEVIHEAANDPNIIGVYGRFGHGFGFKCGGLAHLDEVRKALKVFADSKMLDAAGNDTDTHKLSLAYSVSEKKQTKKGTGHVVCACSTKEIMFVYLTPSYVRVYLCVVLGMLRSLFHNLIRRG